MRKKKRIVRLLIISGLCFFIFFSFFDFIQKTNAINTNTVLEHLEDVGRESANNYNLQFKEFISIIKNTSYSISLIDLNQKEIGELLLSVQQVHPSFKRVWYVDQHKILNNYKENIQYKSQSNFTDNIFNGQEGMTNPFVSSYEQENIVVVYAPVYKNQQIVGGVAGVIEMNNENHNYAYNDFFNNECYVFVASSDGNVISKNNNHNTLYKGDNYFDFLENDVTYTNGSYLDLVNNMVNGESSFITYQYNGQERLAYYTPVLINDWYIFNVVPSDVVYDLNAQMNETTLFLTIKITLFFLITTLFIIRYFIITNRKQKETNDQLMTSNKKIDMILKQTSDRIFEYDIKEDSLILDAWNDFPKIILNHFLMNIHNYNFVAREHEHILKEKFHEIIEQKNNINFDVKLPYISKDEDTWFHISMIYVHENNRLIGILRNSTKEMEEYNLLLQDQMFKNSVYSHSFFMFAVNLKSQKVVIYQKTGVYYNIIDVSYEKFLVDFIEYTHDEDKERVEKFFNYINIQDIYHNEGKNTIEYRIWNIDIHDYEWIRFRVQFERQSSNNEILMIAYSNDINDEKSRQLEYEYRAKRDGLTDLYNRQTFHQFVDKYLNERKSMSDYCAYIILDLDNFKAINDTLGHSVGDYVLQEVSHIIENTCFNNGYAGRYGGDEFVMFLQAQESYTTIENKVRAILKKINSIDLKSYLEVSASIGIKFVKNEKSHHELFDKCDDALYVSKNSGKNRYYVYLDEDEKNTGL